MNEDEEDKAVSPLASDGESFEARIGAYGKLKTLPPAGHLRITLDPPPPSFWQRVRAAFRGAWCALLEGWRTGEWP
jgi:hypothetical protein